ncbi:site-specific integrase [Saccharospirillum alexandrii]|uniref:site-specific integrase n=1 Tax=Saccharospirillum alexandrii TaxID=2448477 RepID=UPI000FD828DB|nr:site-specific integrase [Saccharospirillum alexandrii]
MINETPENTILKLLNPPAKAKGSTLVVELLKTILTNIKLVVKPDDNEISELSDKTESLVRACDNILNDIKDDTSILRENASAGIPKVTVNTVYAELYRISQTPGEIKRHMPLLVAVISSILISNTMEIGGRKIPSGNIQSCLREVRRLVKNQASLTGDSRLSIYKYIDNESPNITGIRVEPIRRLLGISLNLEQPQFRSREDKQGGNNSNNDAELPTELSTNDGFPEKVRLQHTQSVKLSNTQVQQFSSYGLQLSDSVTEVSHVRSETLIPPALSSEPLSNSRNRRNIAAALQRTNQSLSTDWNRLNQFDIAMLINSILPDESLSSEERNADACLLILLSLLTGRPHTEILITRLYTSTEAVPESLSTTPIALCPSGGFWQGQAALPNRERQLNPQWETNLTPTTGQVRLPMPQVIKQALEKFHSGRSGYLFKQSEHQNISELAKSLLTDLNYEHGTRLTMTRIRQTLFHALSNGGGDSVDAMFITGQKPSNGHHAGAYYYSPKNTFLAERYKTVVNEILRETDADPNCTVFRPDASVTIGSPLSPRTDRLPLLVSDLKLNIKRSKKEIGSVKGLYDLHNAYTLYTVFLISFATGYRAVVSPMSRDSDLNRESGVIVIADKIGNDLNHARIVPVPDAVLVQLEHYEKHRGRMRTILNLYHSIDIPIQRLFFVAKKNKTLISVPVRPEQIAKYASEFFDLPININRHFLRGALKEMGVHGEIVDAYLGHWNIGQEPVSKYSTFRPTEYKGTLLPALNLLMSKIGFTPLRGLV